MSLSSKKEKLSKKEIVRDGRVLLLALAVLSTTVATLATSTYAWFVLSDNLVASNIAIEAGKDTLQLGCLKDGAYTYFDKIDNATLETYFPSFSPDDGLLPLSSMYSSTWLNSSTDKNAITPKLLTGYESSNSSAFSSYADKGFMQFDFYVYCSQDVYLFLDSTTTLTADHTTNLKTATEFGYDVADLDSVANAARVSFYSELGYTIYEPNVSASSNTAFAGRLDYSNDGYFDTNSDGEEILYGEYNYQDYQDKKLSLVYDEGARVNEISGKASCFNAKTEAGAKPLDISASEIAGLQIAHEMTYPLTALEAPNTVTLPASAHPLAYAKAYTPTRLVVTVYVEGWDLDSLIGIKDAAFDLNLAFRGFLVSAAE